MTRAQYFCRWLHNATQTEKTVWGRMIDFCTCLEQFAPPQADKDITPVPHWAVKQIESEFRCLFDSTIIRIESVPEKRLMGSQLACTTVETAPDWPLAVVADAIYISPNAATSDSVLLHEMLHIVCGFYTRRSEHAALAVVRQMAKQRLEEALITELQGEINQFDEILDAFQLMYNRSGVQFQRGHNLLFLLMSLEIDLEFGYPKGEVFGYGFQDSIALIAS